MVEDGDVVEIDYIGRILNTGEIFDLTSEETAKEEGHDVEDMDLGPMKVLIGAGHVIPGLENALKDMEEGDDKEVTVSSEDAFGERDSSDIKTISRREFKKYDVTPQRGLVVEIDGRRGKILSTSSGRIRVDFNHPLAGKDVTYEVNVRRILDDPAERAEAVLEFYGMDEADGVELEFDEENNELRLTLPDELQNQQLRDALQNELELVKSVDTVHLE